MAIAIIGGTGFIGSAVARRLIARGLTPIVIARGKHAVSLPDGAILEQVDRMDAGRLADVLLTHRADTVIDIFALSLKNTEPVLGAMKAAGGRYLLLSSVDLYRNYGGLLRRETPPVQHEPAKEGDPLRGFRYPYRGNDRRPQAVDADLLENYDKIILEEAAKAEDSFATTVIRAPMVFGPGDKQRRFRWAIDAVRAGGTIRVDERAAGWPNSYVYVDDLAEGIALAATSPAAAGQTYNVGQPFVRTPVEWLQAFADLLDVEISIGTVPPGQQGLLWERAEASDLRYPLTLDSSRIRRELGFRETVPEADALRATVADEDQGRLG
jgi:nucleoside-diphosphate-sugar epimerase